MSAGEAALGHVLAIPGQLLPTTAPPADTPAPPEVIPAAKWTYTEAVATPALERATHVYEQRRGVGPPLADNYAGLYLVLGLQAAPRGENRGGEQGSAKAPCRASATCGR